MAGALRESLPLAQGHHVGEPCALVRVAAPDESVIGLDRDGMAIVMDEDLAAYIVAACNAVPALVDEVETLREERDHYRHQLAITQPVVVDAGRELIAADSERATLRARLRDAEAQRDALLAHFVNGAHSVETSLGVWCVCLMDAINETVDVATLDTEEAAERAAAAWQQLIDQARAGAAAKGSE